MSIPLTPRYSTSLNVSSVSVTFGSLLFRVEYSRWIRGKDIFGKLVRGKGFRLRVLRDVRQCILDMELGPFSTESGSDSTNRLLDPQ